MVIDDQREVLTVLSRPATYGPSCQAVERIDTHSAAVFLTGDRAFKLKRAVRYDYLDFSTVERRRQCCEAELALNARTAPSIYRRVVPLTRDGHGSLVLDGPGLPVEWLLEMRRFDGDALCDRLAERGALSLPDDAGPRSGGSGNARFCGTCLARPRRGGGHALGHRRQCRGVRVVR